MRIESINKVREYPDDDGQYCTLIVRNHSTLHGRVVLQLAGANHDKEYVFIAADLRLAISNAENCS